MDAVRFRYTEADLIAANLAFYHASLRSVRTWLPGTVLTIMAIGAIVLVTRDDPGGALMPVIGGLVGAVVVGVLIHLFNRRYLRRYAIRNFAQQRSLREEFTVTWDDNAFESRSATGSQRVAWGDLYRWTDSGGLVMLYLAERLYVALPRDALSEDQRADIRRRLDAALPGGVRRA